jgi:hypothetical protein
MEILTGEKQDKGWIEVLTHFIETVEPNFFYKGGVLSIFFWMEVSMGLFFAEGCRTKRVKF